MAATNESRLSCGALKKDPFTLSTRAASFKRSLGGSARTCTNCHVGARSTELAVIVGKQVKEEIPFCKLVTVLHGKSTHLRRERHNQVVGAARDDETSYWSIGQDFITSSHQPPFEEGGPRFKSSDMLTIKMNKRPVSLMQIIRETVPLPLAKWSERRSQAHWIEPFSFRVADEVFDEP